MVLPDGDYGTAVSWAEPDRICFTRRVKDYELVGWLALAFGLAMLLFGIYGSASAIAAIDMERVFLVAGGGILTAAGVHFCLWRTGVIIDRDCGLVMQWWGLVTPFWSKDHPLDGFVRVKVCPDEPNWRSLPCDLGSERAGNVYPVHLVGPVGEVELTRLKDADEARMFANELAGHLGIEYHAVPGISGS